MMHHVEDRAMSTLPQILAAIAHFHSRAHLTSPTQSSSVQRALEGAKRGFGAPSKPRKIMTPEILRAVINLTRSPSSTFVTLRTVWRLLIEFYALLRFREVAELTLQDIKFDEEGCTINIKRSKTDQRGVGATTRIHFHKDSSACPVLFTKMYVSRLGYKAGIMLPLVKGRGLCPESSISYHTALNDLRAVLKAVRIDGSGYGEHSGRRGGTTAAAAVGVSHAALKTQGRWKSDASVERYTDNATSARAEFAAALAS